MSRANKNVVAKFLSRQPFLNTKSLVKNTILDNIKEFYRNDVFFTILFESLLKESRT